MCMGVWYNNYMMFSFAYRKCLLMAPTVLKLLFKLIGFGNILQLTAYYNAFHILNKRILTSIPTYSFMAFTEAHLPLSYHNTSRLPWQKQRSTRRRLHQQQIGFKFKKETSKLVRLEQMLLLMLLYLGDFRKLIINVWKVLKGGL